MFLGVPTNRILCLCFTKGIRNHLAFTPKNDPVHNELILKLRLRECLSPLLKETFRKISNLINEVRGDSKMIKSMISDIKPIFIVVLSILD